MIENIDSNDANFGTEDDKDYDMAKENIESIEDVTSEINELVIKQQQQLQNLAPYIYRVIPDCTREHLKYCDCQKELYDKFRKEEKIRIYNEMEKSGMLEHDPGTARSRLKEASGFAKDRLVKYCEKNHLKCTYHTEQLQNIYNLFSVKYDMKDPKVVISLTVLMSNLSSLIKAQSFSNKKGIIQQEFDKAGNEILNTYMNEKLKIEINNAIMKTMKTLDEVIEGSKSVNLNINANEIQPIRDIFGDNK
jgi:hypothetical protein